MRDLIKKRLIPFLLVLLCLSLCVAVVAVAENTSNEPTSENVIVTWGQTTNFVYDGNSHVPTATVTQGNVTIPSTVTGGETNAGTYTATVTYTVDGVEKRETTNFTIEKSSATVTWSNTSLVYNGETQKPTALVNATPSVTPVVSGEGKDAGTYEAKVTWDKIDKI